MTPVSLMQYLSHRSSFRAFWGGIKESQRKSLSCEKTDTILKSVVKKFFNEKEVTSTLVMDALFSGTKSLERTYKVRAGQEEWATPTVWLDKENFVLSADVLTVLDRAVHEPIPAYKDDKGSGTPHRVKVSASDGDQDGAFVFCLAVCNSMQLALR